MVFTTMEISNNTWIKLNNLAITLEDGTADWPTRTDR